MRVLRFKKEVDIDIFEDSAREYIHTYIHTYIYIYMIKVCMENIILNV